ncbi:hypothetical protein Sinac_4613 [Singulisphaera acidiphila DSM 18658]|uniref:Uncharacterized protein n=1 Tax=Singulisphaera acidiphila (strain ATCC BAA-1392 / DSM 18658 / VKM B-2454 / MOB10) TaxID=886293 RepID=L0DJD9_SINAD|nr:hypothetical protein Sinac_4613 [Singulisphaera acidiphila DSM 18658]
MFVAPTQAKGTTKQTKITESPKRIHSVLTGLMRFRFFPCSPW